MAFALVLALFVLGGLDRRRASADAWMRAAGVPWQKFTKRYTRRNRTRPPDPFNNALLRVLPGCIFSHFISFFQPFDPRLIQPRLMMDMPIAANALGTLGAV